MTFLRLKNRLEDLLFNMILALPDSLIPNSLMDCLASYINKRTNEVQADIVKSKWQQNELESTLKNVQKKHS